MGFSLFKPSRAEKQLKEIQDGALKVVESQRKLIDALSATNERLDRDLAQAHADRAKFATELQKALSDLVAIKTGVLSGAKRAIDVLESDRSEQSEKELIDAFKEILRAANHDASSGS